jgi:hypothetical protein
MLGVDAVGWSGVETGFGALMSTKPAATARQTRLRAVVQVVVAS